jgi:hypothetical protein
MQRSASELPSGTSKLLAAPFGALAALIAGLLILTIFLGAASRSCGKKPLGALNSKVPQRLVPIYERAAAKYGLGPRGPAILAGVNWVETSFGN